MTSRDFCYWLQGLFEAGEPTALNEKQTDLVKRHLALVFVHELDPAAGPPEHQKVLNEIHAAASAEQNNPPKQTPQIGGHGPGGTVYRC